MIIILHVRVDSTRFTSSVWRSKLRPLRLRPAASAAPSWELFVIRGQPKYLLWHLATSCIHWRVVRACSVVLAFRLNICLISASLFLIGLGLSIVRYEEEAKNASWSKPDLKTPFPPDTPVSGRPAEPWKRRERRQRRQASLGPVNELGAGSGFRVQFHYWIIAN
ncbi:hypothetical protein BJ170DRAFT_622521 [Xylariales sp. AK1849]|nr:hypothetical protein BJ170DRAFT_622521 [Xylariales sp. AK1849]